jgi:hypothetical protein
MGGLNMARFAHAIAVAAVLFAGSTAEGKLLVGAGIQSCGTWRTQDRQSSSSIAVVQWVLGYISSANTFAPRTYLTPNEQEKVPDVLRGLDANAIITWMDNYCREHPLDQISTAASDLMMELLVRN